jgi:ADP-ribosylglycohydrolase
MYGAVIGDVVGSRFEFDPIKTTDFELFHENCIWTDDTVMTAAVGDALLHGSDMAATMRRWGKEYVTSYGHHFWDWLQDPTMGPYGSYGNGSSMRVSAAAWLARDLAECLEMAKRSAEVSHNHPEGIRGAQATAAAIHAGLRGMDGQEIRTLIADLFGYDLSPAVREIRPANAFEIKSWISVPQALTCAFEASSFEEAIRLAVSIGGDADTQAAIAGSVAETLFAEPEALAAEALSRIPEPIAQMLAEVRRAGQAIPRPLLSAAEIAAVPRWDPESVVRWNEAINVKFGVAEDPPGYAEEMAKIAGLFGGGPVAVPVSKSWADRLGAALGLRKR